MKYFILLLLCACNFLGETTQDDNFIFSIPQDSLLLWLDASAKNKVNDDGAENVTGWQDLSDHQYNLAPVGTHPTIYTAQINGLDVINFDATGDGLSIVPSALSASNYTFIAIIEPAYTLSTYNVLSITAAVSNFKINTAGQQMIWSDGVDEMSPLIPEIGNHPMIISYVLKDPDLDMYLNGDHVHHAAGVYSAQAISGNVQIGTQGFGYVGEVFLYNRALADNEREFIETYLASKWGI